VRQVVATGPAFANGNAVQVTASAEAGALPCVIFREADRGPIAWCGPIGTNSQEDLRRAFQELDDGTFIKSGAEGRRNR
jgi:redox-sensitive bicupin YhaK (pirin superfamily)